MDTLETEMADAEEKEMEKEVLQKKRGDDQSGQQEKEEEIPQSKDMNEVKEEKLLDTKIVSKKILLHIKPKDKKQAGDLNINNEVVKMRKEVKRVRALIVRKLTRQIQALKKKKGKDREVERNQRRALRLLEEIHAMKVLSADLVTKTALHRNLNFEQVFKNPNSTITDRAVTRIATHPQFRKRIEEIKGAMAAFKEERIRAGKQKGQFEEQNQSKNQTDSLGNTRKNEVEKEKEEKTMNQKAVIDNENQKEVIDNEKGHNAATDSKDKISAKPKGKKCKAACAAEKADGLMHDIPPKGDMRPLLIKESLDIVKNAPEVHQQEDDQRESLLESLDEEEKEYFDDSTEERFHRQSSSEESDDEDEFFIGKVSKFKKKKNKKYEEGTEKVGSPTNLIQNQPDMVEARLKAKASLFQSVFCSSLSVSQTGVVKGRGRDEAELRGPEGCSSSARNLRKKSKIQQQEQGTGCSSGFNHKKPCPRGSSPESQLKGSTSRRKWKGQRRGHVTEQHVRCESVFHHQPQNTALHPSWEASKKRKEQQGQILAFQGKKIKFDDFD